ncbi:MAG TPA: hypothetical protein VF230_15175 [Acidimicrobiales bacterium]
MTPRAVDPIDFDEWAPALRSGIRCLREHAATLRHQGFGHNPARAQELEAHAEALLRLARQLGDLTPPQGIRLDGKKKSTAS